MANQQKSLKILIDAQPLIGQLTGIGNYVKGLTEGLSSLPKNTYSYELVAFDFMSKSSQASTTNTLKFRKIRYLPVQLFNRLLRYGLMPPLDLFFGKKIYFFANFVRWPLLFSKSIVVIYDLAYLHHPEYLAESNRRFMSSRVPDSIRKADHVVAISENTRQELMKAYNIPKNQTSIVYPAINHSHYKPQPKQIVTKVHEKLSIKPNYLLFVGTLEPRKNIVGLIEAFVALPNDIKAKHQLVIVGGRGWKDKTIANSLEQHEQENINYVGYVSDEDMPAVYSGAALFVYPTYYEGFGMPVLESMACGAPVLCAKNSSLPEVLGSAGVYFDASNTKELTKKMKTLLNNKAKLNELSKKGLERAANFSWQKSAAQLQEVFEKVSKQ